MIPERELVALRDLLAVADREGVPFLLVGAFARKLAFDEGIDPDWSVVTVDTASAWLLGLDVARAFPPAIRARVAAIVGSLPEVALASVARRTGRIPTDEDVDRVRARFGTFVAGLAHEPPGGSPPNPPSSPIR